MNSRVLKLPSMGVLLVSTDLHGNHEDFARMRELFLAEHDAHWVQLGDLVHAPSEYARRHTPELYDFPDGSIDIVLGFAALQREHPGRVHVVLGNHDHAHVGGPHTRKFHADEVEHLESTMTPAELEVLRTLFSNASLAAVAPCGALLCHGSPDDSLTYLRALDDVPLDISRGTDAQRALLRTLLTSYGQPGEVTARVLAAVSEPGTPLTFLIHGHDRDPSGWFTEGGNQAEPVIFGALRENKRYLRLSLSARYPGVDALRDGEEIRRLYPAG